MLPPRDLTHYRHRSQVLPPSDRNSTKVLFHSTPICAIWVGMSVTWGMICLCPLFIKLAGVKFEKRNYLGGINTKIFTQLFHWVRGSFDGKMRRNSYALRIAHHCDLWLRLSYLIGWSLVINRRWTPVRCRTCLGLLPGSKRHLEWLVIPLSIKY